MSNHAESKYYLPGPSSWPIIASIALFTLVFGAANWLHGEAFGRYVFIFGALMLVFMIVGWFSTVIQEDRNGISKGTQIDRSFRWGMIAFIFTEVMFFAAFFGTLFYIRQITVPWLGGVGDKVMSHVLLWPHFKATWPLFQTPDPQYFMGPKDVMETWGIPAINTLILLTSGATITVAHWALIKNRRALMITFQALTVLLGIAFLSMQAHEYLIAYTEKGLKLSSGIYGSTFFMLTGFHAFHVTIGTIGLISVFYRMLRNDFTDKDHFAFEAVAWYWHFVDVVWLGLFIFVYWL